MTVLVTAASEHGATGELATAVAEALRRRGLDVVVMPPDDGCSIEEFGAVALGSAVCSGHWLKPATDLVERSAAALAARRVWLFSSGPCGIPLASWCRRWARTRSTSRRSVQRPAHVSITCSRANLSVRTWAALSELR